MARQGHQAESYLHKVGLEGFALLDQCFGGSKNKKAGRPPTRPDDYHHNNNEFYWSRKPERFPPPQSYDDNHHDNGEKWNDRFQRGYVYWGPQVITVREPVIDCNQAAQQYGGKVFVDHFKGNAVRKGYQASAFL